MQIWVNYIGPRICIELVNLKLIVQRLQGQIVMCIEILRLFVVAVITRTVDSW